MCKWKFLYSIGWAIFIIKFPIRLTLFGIVKLGELIEKYQDIICYPENNIHRAATQEYYKKTGKSYDDR